jgi:Copper type II ascorbate-dependent monooxygenase, C-terminal domain
MNRMLLLNTALCVSIGAGLVLAQNAPAQTPPAHSTHTQHDHGGSSQAATERPHPASQLGQQSPRVRETAPPLRVDLELTMRQPYVPSEKLSDDYRCFVLDPGLTEDRFFTGFEVKPGNPEVVHHVILNAVPPEAISQIRELDGQDGQDGWSCFGGTGLQAGPAGGTGGMGSPGGGLKLGSGAASFGALMKLQERGVNVNALIKALQEHRGNVPAALAAYQQAGGDLTALLSALQAEGLLGAGGLGDGAHAGSGDAMTVITSGLGDVFGVGSWVPGSVPTHFPEGTGRLLKKGTLLVMQVHYNTLAGREHDRTSVQLQLAPAGSQLQPLTGMSLVAPVEIPCPAGATGELCNRDALIRKNTAEDGPRAAMTPAALLALCQKKPEDYAKQNPKQVVSTCDMRVREDALAVGVNFHMHTLGTSGLLELNPGTNREQVLLEIPNWDFHWQGSYFYREPITLKKGDTVRITCTWDTTLNPEPRYIVWGEGTRDEMCLGGLTLMPTPRE